MDRTPVSQRVKQQRLGLQVHAMGRALGVDLDHLARTNVLPPNLRESLSVRCMGCLHPHACDSWLARHVETGADATPLYCRNREVVQELAREHGTKGALSAPSLAVVANDNDQVDDAALRAVIRGICSKVA